MSAPRVSWWAIRPEPALTERARLWATRRVGEDGPAVEDVRLERGMNWSEEWP